MYSQVGYHPIHTTTPSLSSSNFFTNKIARRVPISLRVLYPFVHFILGALLLSIVLNLSVWADSCGVSTIVASWSLVIQGLGIVCSIPFQYYFLTCYYAHDTIPIGLFMLTLITLCLPFVTSFTVLCLVSFLIGFLCNMILVETYNITRKLYSSDAGPWCSLSQLSFAFGGIVSIIVAFTLTTETDDDSSSSSSYSICLNCSPWYYIGLACVMVYLAFTFFCVPNPEKIRLLMVTLDDSSGSNSGGDAHSDDPHHVVSESTPLISSQIPHIQTNNFSSSSSSMVQMYPIGTRGDFLAPHYFVEMALSCTLGIAMGSFCSLLAFTYTYAEELNFETFKQSYYQTTVALSLFCFGLIVTIIDQAIGLQYYDAMVNNFYVPIKIIGCSLIAAFALFLVPMAFDSNEVFWFATSMSGLMYGPIIGYTFDWLNRTTFATLYSTAIVITGMNVGLAIVIMGIYAVWYSGFGFWSIVYVPGIITLFIIPLIWHSRFLSYRPEINSMMPLPGPPGPFSMPPPPFGMGPPPPPGGPFGRPI